MLDLNRLKLNMNCKSEQSRSENIKVENTNSRDIAIIGMSMKFPMANNKEEYWQNLKNGKDCVTFLPEYRKEDADKLAKYLGLGDDPKYFECAYIDEIDKFDYKFFRISPKEASLMDPHQRMFLQTAWGAIEDAGYGGDKIVGTRTGVYAGRSDLGDVSYKELVSEVEPQFFGTSIVGNTQAILPSRISYLLDLKGPSMVIDTACSSSMVALNMACQALRNKQCEMALVGGVRLYHLPFEDRILMGIESSNGRTKTFDEASDGTGVGEGVAAILIKPLGQAVQDRDNIYAVIKGGAINQDGDSMGITVPNANAQADVIDNAWKDAHIDPTTISYIEAHGTGTKLGDPIEIDGIQKAFEKYTNRKQFCAIASVKTNIGHLYDLSGMASIIKAVIALNEKQLPPNIHFSSPNPNICFYNSPVYLNNTLQEWESEDMPRRCGVSAFGISGTNCHIVLEEYKKSEKDIEEKDKVPNIFTLSAKCKESLVEMLHSYKKFLEEKRNIFLDDICYTVNTGRGHYNYRIAIIARNKKELIEKIDVLIQNNLNSNDKDGIFSSNFNVISLNDNKIREDNYITEEQEKELSRSTEEKVKKFIASEKREEKLLMDICKLYSQGARVFWNNIYLGEKRNKVSLPTYKFKRERCWLQIPEGKKPGVYRNEFVSQLDREDIPEEIASELRSIISKLSNVTAEVKEDTSCKVKLKGRKENKYTDTELKIAEIWNEVLGGKEINIYENFYELGGDSIMAMNIVNLTVKVFGICINVSDILKYNTIQELAKYIDKEHLSTYGSPNINTLLKIEKAEEMDNYPVSAAQKRMYVINMINKEDISYNLPGAMILSGQLDIDKYKKAWENLVNRHEILRTSFEMLESGEVIQYIHNQVETVVEIQDADGKEINELINQFIRPFDLGKSPLIRIKLVKLADNTYLCMHDIHHIIADGTSSSVIIRAVSKLYKGIELPKLPIQYKDYAIWQNDFLKSEFVKKQEKYWLSIFNGTLPVLNMPTDYPRPLVKSTEGSRVEYIINKDLSSKINKAALNIDCTLYMILLASYNVLLSKYTLQEDIIIGTPIAGRHYSGTENQIGIFINTIAIRNYPSGKKTFLEFIEEVKSNTMSAFENQDYQFGDIVNKLNITRDSSRNPIFDTMFALQNMFIPEMELDGVKFENYELDHKVSRFDLFMEAWNKEGQISLKLEYSTQLFKEETANNIIKDFIKILEAVVQNVNIKINEIELESSYELVDKLDDEIVEFNF